MALDLSAAQDSIRAYLESSLPQFTFLDGPPTEEEDLPRASDGSGEVPPVFLIWFGKVSTTYDTTMAGARNDGYSTYIDIECVGSDYSNVRLAINLVTDYLTGFRPVGGTELRPNGGASSSSRSQTARPTLYSEQQRFEYNVNIAPSAPPTPPTP